MMDASSDNLISANGEDTRNPEAGSIVAVTVGDNVGVITNVRVGAIVAVGAEVAIAVSTVLTGEQLKRSKASARKHNNCLLIIDLNRHPFYVLTHGL